MKTILPVSSVGTKSIAELQALMSRYSQSVYELSNTARADYQVLQAAIKSGNVPDAQAALARLQSDNRTLDSQAATPSSSSSPQPSSAHSLNATA
jgi:hypothetical protein